MTNRLSAKYLDSAKAYREWAERDIAMQGYLDFSDEALFAMFLFESKGDKKIKSNNGYLHGKHLIDLTVKMWKQDLGTLLFGFELVSEYSEPFLKKWFPNAYTK